MEVTQVYDILNTVTKEVLGESVIVNEDLSNIVDIGNAFENAQAVDNYVKALHDVIGRMVFVDRVYRGRAPSVLMDGWEYGSILEKISGWLPEAQVNESWELTDGASYDPNIFYKPEISVKLFNSKVTYEIAVSLTHTQVLEAFQNPTQLNALYSMIYTNIQNSMTLKNDALIMRTINNMIAETVYADYQGGDLTTQSGVRAVNLLYKYNTERSANLTAAQAITDPDFLRFAAMTIRNYVYRMSIASTLFNIGNTPKFTPRDDLHIVLLSDFVSGAEVYLQSDVFHDQLTELPPADTVAFWQGSGSSFDFADTGTIDVKTSTNNTVRVTGVIGFLFDRNALGVTNQNPRVTTNWNAKAEFWNEWHKWDASYFNDLNENAVVFFVA